MILRCWSRVIFCVAVYMALLSSSCTTYEKVTVYHRDYDPGWDDRLLFNGYYDDTVYEEFEAFGGRIIKDPVRPVFFYDDGTAILGWAASNMDSVASFIRRGWHNIGFWGNYKITGDTIVIEFLTHNGGSGVMETHIKKGVLDKGSIYFPRQQSHSKQPVSPAYTIFFHPFPLKPDSTKSWIRQHRRYKKKRT